MKPNHRQLKKFLAIVAASAAGVLVYLPASALVSSFGSNNNPSSDVLSQDIPSSPLPTVTPSLPETPTPSPLPTLDATPTPLPTVDTIPTPLPEETPTPDVTPTTDVTPTPDVMPTPGVPAPPVGAPEKGSWRCLNNPNPACK